MGDQTRPSTLEELYRAFQDKEHELSGLDLMLADYHAERSSLIRELRWLQAQISDAEEAAPFVPETKPT